MPRPLRVTARVLTITCLALAAACARRREPAQPPVPERTVPDAVRCSGRAACVQRDGIEVSAESSAPFSELVLLDVLDALGASRTAYADLLGGTAPKTTVRFVATSPDSTKVRRETAADGALTLTIPVGALPKREDALFTRSAARRARWEAGDAWLTSWAAAGGARDTTAQPAWVRAGLLAILADRPRSRDMHLRYQVEDRLPLRDLWPNVEVASAPPIQRAVSQGRGRRGEQPGYGAQQQQRGRGPGGIMILDAAGEGLRLPLTDLAVAQAASVLSYLQRTVGKQEFPGLARRLLAGDPLLAALRQTSGAPVDVETLERDWLRALNTGR